MKTSLCIIVILFSLTYSLSAQEASNEEERKGHRITLGLGHTNLAKGKNAEGKTVWLVEPSWSFSYDYWFNNRWAIGLHTDLVVERFIVEDSDGDELERERPFSVVPVAIFKPTRHFSFMAGVGVEFEKEKNLGLVRLGTEYGVEIVNGWEAGVGVVWDNKWDHYNAWMIELSFSKFFAWK